MLSKKIKSEKLKRNFKKYLLVAFIIQLLPVLVENPFTNLLFDSLTALNVMAALTAGFSFYFYLFNKDKLALRTIPILLGLSLIVHTIIYLFIIVDPTFWGYFIDLEIIIILAFFIGGLIIYGWTILLFWIGKKLKGWLKNKFYIL